LPKSSIALAGGGVKRPRAAYRADTRDGCPRRPDVLSKMPRSCKVTFDVLRSFAMGEAVELSIRDLAPYRLATVRPGPWPPFDFPSQVGATEFSTEK